MSGKVFSLVSVPSCAARKGATDDTGIAILIFLGFIVFVIGLIMYIKALVSAANHNQWGWVILILFLWPMFIFYRKPREERREFSEERREPTIGEGP